MEIILNQLLTFFTFFTENHFFKFHSDTVNLSEVKLIGYLTYFTSFLHYKLAQFQAEQFRLSHTRVRHKKGHSYIFKCVTYCQSLDARLPVYEDTKRIEKFKSENIVRGSFNIFFFHLWTITYSL